ncbi:MULTISPECIES: MFS transporter [Streptomyces]|uniref:MFS transporter n=1 Tax=Streptomyces TaxID=1883 RepID=UPI002119DF57|nr:MFS transporter [Streptomyces hilarionis]MCQ9131392.1 MFS transporter [Streptomyces hilarionis]
MTEQSTSPAAARDPKPPGPALGPLVRPLAVSHFVTYFGDGLFYVCAALYFTRVVGLEPVTYGAALTASWLLAMVLSVPVGHLADRFEARTVAVSLLAVAGLSICLYLATSNVPLFFVGACLLAVSTQGTMSARSALIARSFPPDRVTRVRAVLIATANAGLAVGAALGALVIAVDTDGAYRLAFALDGLSFFLAAALLLKVPRTLRTAVASPADGDAAAEAGGSPLGVFRDRGYAAVSLVNLVLMLHVPLIDVALPLWIVRQTHAPEWSIAAVFMINTGLVVALQYRTAKTVTSVDAGVRSLRVGGVLLFTGMALYSLSGLPSSPWAAGGVLVLAVTVLTFGEIRQISSMNEISFRLVADGRYGEYQGFFGIGSTIAEAVGPLALTWLLLSHGSWGWLALGALFLGASFAMKYCVALARRSPLVRENAS